MVKPVLVIMAAGMGSRYGGLKQIDPIDDKGQIIMDFSIFDAKEAGFEKVVFIIKKENLSLFRECVGDKVSKHMKVTYVFQETADLPKGYEVPADRVKPWGTGQAVLSCRDAVKGPFAVINADDYYGKEAFQLIYNYLLENEDDDKYRYTMVGYQLKNTVTENGHVARGVCEIDSKGKLLEVNERVRIEKHAAGIEYSEDDGTSWTSLDDDAVVSMNMWGFSRSMIDELEERFPAFLDVAIKENPLKAEFFLPSVITELLQEGKAEVEVLTSKDKWHGVTYKEDKPIVVAALQKMKDDGKYPDILYKAEEE